MARFNPSPLFTLAYKRDVGRCFGPLYHGQQSLPASRIPHEARRVPSDCCGWEGISHRSHPVRSAAVTPAGTSLANDLSDAIDHAIRQLAPSAIVVLSLTWRDPDAVAMNTTTGCADLRARRRYSRWAQAGAREKTVSFDWIQSS